MTIVRSKQESRGFYMLENSLANDPGISWAAKGMLVFLLAKPDAWRVCIEALVSFTLPATPKNVGKDGVYSIIKELVNAGYMTKHKHRDGTLDYMVYDSRQECESADREIPDLAQNQQNGNFPNRENPDREIPPLVKTIKAVKTVKALSKTQGEPVALPEWLDSEAWAEWLAYRKDVKRKPVTLTDKTATATFNAIRAMLDAGHTLQDCVDNSIANGYQGLFAPTNTTKTGAKVVKSRHDLSGMKYAETGDNIPF